MQNGQTIELLDYQAIGLSMRTRWCQVCTVQNNIENRPIGE